MRLYMKITKMDFEEDNIEHNIIRGMSDFAFLGYDEMVELPDDDKFIKDTLKITYKEDTGEVENKAFLVMKQDFDGFPLYEFKNGKIKHFDYSQYSYFAGTRRRGMLKGKISQIYNPPSEAKIMRKTLKYIMDELKLKYPDYFDKYNKKVDNIIKKNPKDKSK